MNVQPARIGEAASIAALLNENARHTGRPAAHTTQSVLGRINRPATVPERDAFVVAVGGELLGFGHLWTESGHRQVQCFARVRPSAAGRGVGTLLLNHAAAVGAAIFDQEHTLRCTSPSSDDAARALFMENQFTAVQCFVSMELDLTSEMLTLVWTPHPALTLRTNPNAMELADIYALYVRIYSDPGIKAVPFGADRWANEVTTGNEHFDPALWVEAFDGDRLVGYVIAELHNAQGYVAEIGVDATYRRKGVASFLFATVSQKLISAGAETLALEVDALNESGAIQLYEHLGMKGTPRFTVWEKLFS